MIELLIVIAIIGILATTLVPKLIKEIRKATVAKVQHNLGVIRSRLSLDDTFLDEFPDLAGDENTDLLKAYSVEPTPPFTDENGSHGESSEIVSSRNNKGGWYYIRDLGEIYANLPNGAYTKDEEYEIWNGKESEDNSGGGEVIKPTDPIGGDWDKFIEGAIKDNKTTNGVWYGLITFDQGPSGNAITPIEWSQNDWEKTYLYDINHNLIPNPDPNSDDGSYKYKEVIDVSTTGSNNSTDYIVVLEKTINKGTDKEKIIYLYSDEK